MPSAANEFRRAFQSASIQNSFNTKLLGSRAIGLDRVDSIAFEGRLHAESEIIERKVLNGTYNFTKFKEKLVSKGAGKAPRQLSIPTIRDRLALRIVCDILFSIFPECKPNVPQVHISGVAAAINSALYTHYIKIDLKDFYPSINHKILMGRLHKKVRVPQFKSLIFKAISNPTTSHGSRHPAAAVSKGVAQGLSISNVLAEIFMQEIDGRLSTSGDAYFRFVDDILILTDGQAAAKYSNAIGVLRASKLNPHVLEQSGSKTRVGKLSEDFDFLGYSFAPGALRPRESSILAFESSLVEVFSEYSHRTRNAATVAGRTAALNRFLWMVNLKITGCIYKNQRFGWVFYFSQITDKSVLRRIDNTIVSLWSRFKLPGGIRPKRLLKAFYESKRTDKSQHRYIPNYDDMSAGNKRGLLEGIGIDTAALNDVGVSVLFHRTVRRATKRLERDIGNLS